MVAALDMGYGHLRAALPVAEALGVAVTLADAPPVAGSDERRAWSVARAWYERTSRGTQFPVLGGWVRRTLDAVTAIDHLHPYRDQSRPDAATRMLLASIRSGVGRGLAQAAERAGARIVATHFAAALGAEAHGNTEVECVVTDADIARAWVAADPRASRVRYLAPTRRAVRRLLSYGVPRERVRLTGFPLPPSLLGGPGLPALRANLAARLVRLDPSGSFREARQREIECVLGPLPEDRRAPHVVFAVGGAGAQAGFPRSFLPSLAPLLRRDALRLTLVAGVRADVRDAFERALREAGLPPGAAGILHEPDFTAYYRRFNELLAETDVLWTKPSELTFYGALGLPLVLGPPVGVHESYNRRHARERGAGLKQRDPRHAGQWLMEWLDEGVLAAAAWAGHLMLPSCGTYRIAEAASDVTAHSRPA